jgi:succinate-acetate transporter protein
MSENCNENFQNISSWILKVKLSKYCSEICSKNHFGNFWCKFKQNLNHCSTLQRCTELYNATWYLKIWGICYYLILLAEMIEKHTISKINISKTSVVNDLK